MSGERNCGRGKPRSARPAHREVSLHAPAACAGRTSPNAGCETARRRPEPSAGEREMGDTAWGADRLHIEALLECLQPVPDTFPASQNYGDDRYVHVIDQVGGEKLADYRWSAANADVQATGGLL